MPDIEPGMQGHSNGGFSDVPNWEIPKAPPKIKPSVTDLLFPDLYKMSNKKRNQARVLRTTMILDGPDRRFSATPPKSSVKP